MDYNKEKFYELIDSYFINNEELLTFDILSNDIDPIVLTLSDYIANNKEKLTNKSKELIKIIEWIYKEESITNSGKLVQHFLDETDSHNIVAIFVDTDVKDMLINIYTFDLIEKIRFAKMQKESLRDTSTYNRHIEKVLTNMKNDLVVLFELEVDYSEILPALEKYYEFNRYVNTQKCWKEFISLKSYPLFIKFIETKKDIQNYCSEL